MNEIETILKGVAIPDEVRAKLTALYQRLTAPELTEPERSLLKSLALQGLLEKQLDGACGVPGKGLLYFKLLEDRGLAEGGGMSDGHFFHASRKGRSWLISNGILH